MKKPTTLKKRDRVSWGGLSVSRIMGIAEGVLGGGYAIVAEIIRAGAPEIALLSPDGKKVEKIISFVDANKKNFPIHIISSVSFIDDEEGIETAIVVIEDKGLRSYVLFKALKKKPDTFVELTRFGAWGKRFSGIWQEDIFHGVSDGSAFFRSFAVDLKEGEAEYHESFLFTSRPGFWDRGVLRLISTIETDEGLLVIYDASNRDAENNKKHILRAGAILFDTTTWEVLWRLDHPVIEEVAESVSGIIRPVGATVLGDDLHVLWTDADKVLYSYIVSWKHLVEPHSPKMSVLQRHHGNPILSPRPEHAWEAEGVFNPAIFEIDGTIHMLYRAMGRDGVSRFGHATSEDGFSFENRSDKPVYEPSKRYELPPTGKEAPGFHQDNPSGGGAGGSEDPRAVRIGNKIYVTYVAFGGWDSLRMAINSIAVKEIKKGTWKWGRSALMSSPGEMNKNWVVFPEKINGKFVVLHSITPNVLVDYVDSLDAFGKSKNHIQSRPPMGGRKNFWDNKVRGAGPPPIKTDAGWLLFYHATDVKDPNRYKIGAMLLDLKDPTKILHRSAWPLIVPDMHYENDWKPGVVYASGAHIKDGELFVYYGGGDKHVCVATAPLKQFLDELVAHKDIHLQVKEVEIK
jgi:predicted GH43/DUF377 family glycosyl hydrolase